MRLLLVGGPSQHLVVVSGKDLATTVSQHQSTLGTLPVNVVPRSTATTMSGLELEPMAEMLIGDIVSGWEKGRRKGN